MIPNIADVRNPVPDLLHTIIRQNQTIERRMETSVAASIASGMIAATGRPHTITEALELTFDVQMALYPPEPGSGRGKQWKETKEQRMAKAHE